VTYDPLAGDVRRPSGCVPWLLGLAIATAIVAWMVATAMWRG
jgi:hypothetical protein